MKDNNELNSPLESEATEALMDEEGKHDFLKLAQAAYSESTDFMEASLRKQRENNYALFNSKHVAGSKYYTDAYKFRSKFFRPKIRGAIRRHEAACAIAYFSTQDVVAIEAENPADEFQHASAKLQHEVLNYRLENSIRWFQTLIGAYQEAMVVGAVCSKQYWDYEEKVTYSYELAVDELGQPIFDEETGEEMYTEVEDVKVITDKPVVKLLPPENVRYSPASDWVDPVNSSPYFIHMIPMFIDDIKARMTREDPKTGQPEWKSLTDAEIMSSQGMEYDSTRQAREGSDRQDSKENNSEVSNFNIRWVHENFIRIDGEDMIFYTLGTQFLLSDPVPVKEVYLQGVRPFVIGVSQIEAHRLEPTSVAQLGQSSNEEANDIANQRRDNVKLAMNKRYTLKRTAQVDTRALSRSTPGGTVLVDSHDDIKVHETNDVTASSFNEQDRISLDFDEVVGSFSPSSVQSNRKLNETVGGMELLSDDANALAEYQLRVFSETWTEPVLKQLAALEREYETDETVIYLAGDRAQIWDQVRASQADMMTVEHPVRVAVGFGATSPQKRVEKISIGLQTLAGYVPQYMQKLNPEALATEIFGALGFKNADRFFSTPEEQEDPRIAELTQMVQQLQSALQGKQMEIESKVQIADMNNQTKLQIAQIKQQGDAEMAQFQQQIDYVNAQISAEKNQIARGELELQKQALIYQMKLKEVELLRASKDSMTSILMNDAYGMTPKAEG